MATANGIWDARSVANTFPGWLSEAPTYDTVEKIYAQMFNLSQWANTGGYTNTNVFDMWANILIDNGYSGNVNATCNAFQNLFAIMYGQTAPF